MASEASQTYKPKNFQNLLSYYATLVKNAMLEAISGLSAESPFTPEKWPVTTTDEWGRTETTYVANTGYAYGQSILDAFHSTSTSIRDSLMTLFINYDDDKNLWQEDFNFNIINAYASASQSLQRYNEATEEFDDMPEYWFTRGCWYEMLPMCTKGDYIRAWHSNVLQAVEAIKTCRHNFENYEVFIPYSDDDGYGYGSGGYYVSSRSYSYSSSKYARGGRQAKYSLYGNSMFFVQSFWQEYLSGLKSTVDGLLEPIWKFGRATNYPEQNASTAKLKYVTYLASDLQMAYTNGKTSISTAKSLSDKCGTYDAKAAKLKLSK